MRATILKTFVSLLLALLVLLFVVRAAQQERQHLQSIHYEQIDAAEDLSQNLALEHLWLEEYQATGAPSLLEKFRTHRDRANALLAEMTKLSHNASDQDMDSHTSLEALLKDIQQRVRQWQGMAKARLSDDAHAQVENGEGATDEAFDALFEDMLQLNEQIELNVRRQLQAHLDHLAERSFWMFAIAALLVLLSITYASLAFRRRMQGLRRENELLGRLGQSEKEFRDLFELSPVGLWLEDFSHVKVHALELQASGISDLRAYSAEHPGMIRACAGQVGILDMNQAALRMHGADTKDHLLAGLEQTFTEESFGVFREEVLALMDGQTEMTHQACVRRLDGTPLNVIVSLKVMPGHEETLDRILVALSDISQQIRAEADLKDSERRLLMAQAVARLGNWELDMLSGRLHWSAQVFRLFEIDQTRFAASYDAFLERVHPDDRSAIEQAYSRHLEEDVPYDIEHRLLFDDGRIKYVHEMCMTERDADGKPLRSLGTVQDVTERVLADQARVTQMQKMEHVQRLESLGVLAGGIAHDFNNLLTAIMGHAALARQQTGPMDGTIESLRAIENASSKAADLCKQMLAYSGKGKFVVQPINLSELVQEMARLLQVSISKDVSLRHELAGNLPAVEADVAQMQQVIMNLVINASEAIDGNAGMVVIATGVMQVDAEYLHTVYVEEENLDPGAYVYLEVTDNGCGMDARTRKHLFEPFFTTKFTGRGLGMSAIIGIVRGHKGAIKVYSEPGKGTTFKVLFPIVEKDAVSVLAPAAQQGVQRARGTVLVVDDEDSIRVVACIMLENAGYKTMQAADGIDAVALVRMHAEEIDCVLLDMTMPRMGGEECFTEMRRIKSGIKVLLSSGYNQQTATQRFTGKGLAGFVQKPYTPEILLDALQRVLAARVVSGD